MTLATDSSDGVPIRGGPLDGGHAEYALDRGMFAHCGHFYRAVFMFTSESSGYWEFVGARENVRLRKLYAACLDAGEERRE